MERSFQWRNKGHVNMALRGPAEHAEAGCGGLADTRHRFGSGGRGGGASRDGVQRLA